MPPSPEIRIRRARPADRRAVGVLCRRVWDDDYVVDAFADWVPDRRGGLWVALVGGRVVGIAKLTLLGDREAWLHALRVDPDHRRRGIAGALLAHRLERARRLGARVARLDTSEDNVAIRRLTRRLGFREIARYTFFVARARSGVPPRRATAFELPRLWRLTRESDGLIHETRVRRRITRADLARAIRAGRCLVAGDPGHPTALAIVEPSAQRLRLRHLAGRGRGLASLLRALPAEAARQGSRQVGVGAPSSRWRAVRAAGYRSPWSNAMLVFERRLSAAGRTRTVEHAE